MCLYSCFEVDAFSEAPVKSCFELLHLLAKFCKFVFNRRHFSINTIDGAGKELLDFWYREVPGTAHETKLERDFHQDYRTRFGSVPDLGPGVAYDGVMLIASATAPTDPRSDNSLRTCRRRTSM